MGVSLVHLGFSLQVGLILLIADRFSTHGTKHEFYVI